MEPKGLLAAFKDRAVKGSIHIRDHNTNYIGPARGQTARLGVGTVTQFFNGPHHFDAVFFRTLCPFSTLDTVDFDTCAFRATSEIVAKISLP